MIKALLNLLFKAVIILPTAQESPARLILKPEELPQEHHFPEGPIKK